MQRSAPAPQSVERTLASTPATEPAKAPVAATGSVSRSGRPDKLVRDSFRMPSADYAMIGALKQRCITLGVAMKKSGLLRAGLVALQQMPDERLTVIVGSIRSVETGRPAGKKRKKRAKDTPNG